MLAKNLLLKHSISLSFIHLRARTNLDPCVFSPSS